MKTTTIEHATRLAVLLFSLPSLVTADPHRHTHRRLHHEHISSAREESGLKKRSTCDFPSDGGLVAITPGNSNAGWAMSPDQECSLGSYCPYACPPGQVMAQWRPGSTYATSERMDGGLYCEEDGTVSKPFPGSEYCVDGTGKVSVVNQAGSVCSFCQTVLPGNEDILIPNDITDTAVIAVPGVTYWDSTAAHYYINYPGVSSDEGCHWGDSSKPMGNWAPYVAGANTDASGLTYVKLGINPIWQGSSLYSDKPNFGLKIECNGNCVGLPCEVTGDGVNSNEAATGAGGAAFCVVTAEQGSSANIVVYNLDGSSSSSSSSVSTPSSTSKPTSTPSPTPTSTSTTISKPTSTSTSTSQTSSSVHSSSSSSDAFMIMDVSSASSSAAPSSSAGPSSSSRAHGGVFEETASVSSSQSSPTETSVPTTVGAAAASTTSSKSEGAVSQGNGAIMGLIIALVASACML